MDYNISEYELSDEADQDISDIIDYTLDEFGFEQAVEYTTLMEPVFTGLIENPDLGRIRNDIREGLRSVVYQSHVIFYRILNDKIRIVRVLHGSRDMPNLL